MRWGLAMLVATAAVSCGQLSGAPAVDAADAAVDDGAGPDAGAAADGGANPDILADPADGGCGVLPKAIVCADFENTTDPVSGGFEKVVNGPASGAMSVAPDNNGSALLVTTGSLQATDKKQIYVAKELTSPPPSLRFGVRIRRAKTVDAYAEYLVLKTGDTNDLVLTLAGDATNSLRFLSSSGSTLGSDEHTFSEFPSGYTRIDAQIWFEANATELEVWRNGVVVRKRSPLKSPAGKLGIAGTIVFGAGLYFVQGPTSGFDVYLDDVTLTPP